MKKYDADRWLVDVDQSYRSAMIRSFNRAMEDQTQRTITLTEANDEGFDPEALGLDLNKLSDTQLFCVLEVRNHIESGHLNCVTLVYRSGDVMDPSDDPLIIGVIVRNIEGRNDYQYRAMWNNKLWRILDDEYSQFINLLSGTSKAAMSTLAGKLLDKETFGEILQRLSDEDRMGVAMSGIEILSERNKN